MKRLGGRDAAGAFVEGFTATLSPADHFAQ